MQCKAGSTLQNWCQTVEESNLSTRSWPTPLVSPLGGQPSPSMALQYHVQGYCGILVMNDGFAGKDIYVDVNGWHLFLRDITAGPDLKLNQALAQQIGEASSNGRVDLEGLLNKVPIKIGGGKTQVSLYEAIPSFSLDDLEKIVESFERN